MRSGRGGVVGKGRVKKGMNGEGTVEGRVGCGGGGGGGRGRSGLLDLVE